MMNENEIKCELSTIGKLITKKLGMDIGVYAILPNTFDVLDKKFLKVTQSNEQTGISLGEQLFTVRGS